MKIIIYLSMFIGFLFVESRLNACPSDKICIGEAIIYGDDLRVSGIASSTDQGSDVLFMNKFTSATVGRDGDFFFIVDRPTDCTGTVSINNKDVSFRLVNCPAKCPRDDIDKICIIHAEKDGNSTFFYGRGPRQKEIYFDNAFTNWITRNDSWFEFAIDRVPASCEGVIKIGSDAKKVVISNCTPQSTSRPPSVARINRVCNAIATRRACFNLEQIVQSNDELSFVSLDEFLPSGPRRSGYKIFWKWLRKSGNVYNLDHVNWHGPRPNEDIPFNSGAMEMKNRTVFEGQIFRDRNCNGGDATFKLTLDQKC